MARISQFISDVFGHVPSDDYVQMRIDMRLLTIEHGVSDTSYRDVNWDTVHRYEGTAIFTYRGLKIQAVGHIPLFDGDRLMQHGYIDYTPLARN